MESLTSPWQPQINWECTAGQVLKRLFAALPPAPPVTITLFGSAPLQLTLEPGFVSADIDLFSESNIVEATVQTAHLGKNSVGVYIQCCWEGNFRAGPRWRLRAASLACENVTLIIPHPIDLLIAKLHRYEEKDRNAFRLVRERTRHPTEQELLTELQFAVDLYRPNFDEENCGDITANTVIMWREMFGRSIDVRQEIIAPALARRRAGYQADVPAEDYRSRLQELARGDDLG